MQQYFAYRYQATPSAPEQFSWTALCLFFTILLDIKKNNNKILNSSLFLI